MTSGTRRSPGPGRPRDPGADAVILRAAMELLVERGIEGAGIENIARRAGVAKVTVYRRWPSKEDLLADAIEAAREEIPAPDRTGDPDRPLTEVIEELLPRWAESLTRPHFRVLTARLLGAGPGHPRLLAAYREHHVLPRRERALATLRKARDAGALPMDTDLEMLIDMMNGAVMHYLLLGPESPTQEEVEDYLRRLLRQAGFTGLAP